MASNYTVDPYLVPALDLIFTCDVSIIYSTHYIYMNLNLTHTFPCLSTTLYSLLHLHIYLVTLHIVLYVSPFECSHVYMLINIHHSDTVLPWLFKKPESFLIDFALTVYAQTRYTLPNMISACKTSNRVYRRSVHLKYLW